MEKAQAIWDFLDGKKAAIGGALMVAGNILSKFPQTVVAGGICLEVGMWLTGLGLVHKGVKAAKAEG